MLSAKSPVMLATNFINHPISRYDRACTKLLPAPKGTAFPAFQRKCRITLGKPRLHTKASLGSFLLAGFLPGEPLKNMAFAALALPLFPRADTCNAPWLSSVVGDPIRWRCRRVQRHSGSARLLSFAVAPILPPNKSTLSPPRPELPPKCWKPHRRGASMLACGRKCRFMACPPDQLNGSAVGRILKVRELESHSLRQIISSVSV